MVKRFFCVFGILIATSCSNDGNEDIPDTIPPEVSFSIEGTDKSNGQPIVVSNQILVKINANDASGLQKVEAYIDDAKVGEDITAPFQFTIDVSGYASKTTNISSKYKDYTLQITATDIAGNTATSEQLLNIDNDAPSITAVSIEEGSIVNGEVYTVTFEATDNEEISKSVISLNGEVISEISDQEKLFEFNTLELNDGANSLGIEAFDLAGNSTLYVVDFIVDNTGPEINFQNVVDDMVIDEIIALEPSIQDAYSSIGAVTYSLGEQILYEVEEGVDYTWDFNPNDYPTGNTRIVVQATDGLGNVSSTEVPVEILRRLIVINIPEDFYDSADTREKYVFASDNQGKPLAIEPILPESRTIILRTSENIAAGSEFMITFAYYSLPNGSSVSTSSLTTIANISVLSEINLNTSLRAKPLDSKSVPAVGIEKSYQVTARGLSPLTNVQYKPNVGLPEDGEFTLSRKYDAGPKGLEVSKTFVYLKNSNTNTYKYTLLDWDIENITEIRQDMFTEEGVELRRYESEMSNENHKGTILKQFGYFNDYEYQNDIYQQYGSIGYSEGVN